MAGFTALSDGTVRKKYGYFFLSARTGVVAAKESWKTQKRHHLYWCISWLCAEDLPQQNIDPEPDWGGGDTWGKAFC